MEDLNAERSITTRMPNTGAIHLRDWIRKQCPRKPVMPSFRRTDGTCFNARIGTTRYCIMLSSGSLIRGTLSSETTSQVKPFSIQGLLWTAATSGVVTSCEGPPIRQHQVTQMGSHRDDQRGPTEIAHSALEEMV